MAKRVVKKVKKVLKDIDKEDLDEFTERVEKLLNSGKIENRPRLKKALRRLAQAASFLGGLLDG